MEYLLKSALISTVLYSFYKVFLQKETFFQSIRIYFIIGIIVSIVLPIVIIPIYIEVAPIVVSEILENTPFTENLIETEGIIIPIETKEAINWLGLIGIIYLIGVIVFTIKFLIDLASLISLLFYGRKTKIKKYIFVETEKEISPFSFFKFIVYNKNKFSKTELKDIIAHEKVHVQQKHSLDILLMQLLTVVQWYNPFVWLYKKDLQQNLEYIADKEAQEKAKTHKEYQYLLLKTSIKNNPFALSNNFFNSHLKKRIMMLQKSQTKKLNQIKYLLLIPLLAIFLYAFNTKEIIKPQSENLIIDWKNNSKKVIVIDVSHGGKDTGANVENVLEKDIVLEISKKIKTLYKGNVIIEFTREKDEFIKLNDRINIVNKLNPSLLISLHVNRAEDSKSRGLSAYVSEKNNAFEQSKIIANELLNSIANKNLKSRGVSKGNLKIIKEVTSPAVLLELGFLSNGKDRSYIKSNKGQTEIAQSIVDFINGKKTTIKIDRNQDQKFINPIYKENIIKITSGFGKRKSPITKEIKFHNGIDIKAHIGTDVYATADGKVIKAEYNELKGNYIQIQHANKYQTNYHHLDKIQIALGEQVKVGEIISTVGNTGRSTGSHLHYEILKDGKHVNPKFYVNYSSNTKTKQSISLNTIIITSKTTDKEFKKIKKQF